MLTAVRDSRGDRPLIWHAISRRLTRAIDHIGPALVIIDPITAYLGKTNTHKDAAVRGVLAPLLALVAQRGVALIAVAHLNKAEQQQALYRTGGSIAFIASARVAFVVGRDRENGARAIFAPLKSNLSKPAPTLAYRFLDDGGIEWESEPVEIDAATLLSMPTTAAPRSAVDHGEDFLRTVLKSGALPTREVLQLAEKAGLSERAIRRASESLGIERKREGFGPGSYVTLALP